MTNFQALAVSPFCAMAGVGWGCQNRMLHFEIVVKSLEIQSLHKKANNYGSTFSRQNTQCTLKTGKIKGAFFSYFLAKKKKKNPTDALF